MQTINHYALLLILGMGACSSTTWAAPPPNSGDRPAAINFSLPDTPLNFDPPSTPPAAEIASDPTSDRCKELQIDPQFLSSLQYEINRHPRQWEDVISPDELLDQLQYLSPAARRKLGHYDKNRFLRQRQYVYTLTDVVFSVFFPQRLGRITPSEPLTSQLWLAILDDLMS